MEVVAQEVLRRYGVSDSGKQTRTPLFPVDLGNGGPQPVGCARRARTREQGMALVMVGHAIEYLVDSRGGRVAETEGPESEALTILGAASRAAYREGKEIVPLRVRLQRLLPRIAAHKQGRWRRRAVR